MSFQHFTEKKWRHNGANVLSKCDLIKILEIYIRKKISKWTEKSFEESLRREGPDYWISTEDYAYGAAVCRVGRGLASGRLKAFIPISSKRMFEAAPTYWRDAESGSLNVSAIMSPHASTAPFGSDRSYEVPEEAEGREFLFKKVKVQAWLRDHTCPVNRAYAFQDVLYHWYTTSPLDDYTRRSKVRLRIRAIEELGMRVSMSQIDLLVAAEGRTVGRPRTVTE